MTRDGVQAVILAAGHGAIAPGRSKLIEAVGDKPMVSWIFDLVNRDLNIAPVWVVVNGKNQGFSEQVRQSLVANINNGHPKPSFVSQPERTGTAGAIGCVLPNIVNCGHILVLYGDMPCWQADSIARLVDSHLVAASSRGAVISMFSIQLGSSCPETVKAYGRILRDSSGEIIGVREPYEMTEDELAATRSVNPSAWVFDHRWLRANIAYLPPHSKCDGFADEHWLPELVPIAFKQGLTVNEVALDDPREALGVNTIEDLNQVRAFLEVPCFA